MVNKNIQMKKKNGQSWDNLFPITLNENVFNTEGMNLTDQLNKKSDLEYVNTELNNKSDLEYVNQKYDQLNNKIENIISIKDYAVDPTGEQDSLEGFEQAFNDLNNNGVLVLEQNADYYLSDELSVIGNKKITIIGNGSHIHSDVKNGKDALSFYGEEVKQLVTVGGIDKGQHFISTTDYQQVEIGDLLVFTSNDQFNTSREYYKKGGSFTVSLVDKVNNRIYFDGSFPYTIDSTMQVYLYKPISVQITDLKVTGLNPLPNGYFGIRVEHGVNNHLKNITVDNFNHCITFRYHYNTLIEQVKTLRSYYEGSKESYGLSSYIGTLLTITNSTFKSGRHGLEISGFENSFKTLIMNSSIFSENGELDFNTHQCSYDVTLINVVTGTVGLSNKSLLINCLIGRDSESTSQLKSSNNKKDTQFIFKNCIFLGDVTLRNSTDHYSNPSTQFGLIKLEDCINHDLITITLSLSESHLETEKIYIDNTDNVSIILWYPSTLKKLVYKNSQFNKENKKVIESNNGGNILEFLFENNDFTLSPSIEAFQLRGGLDKGVFDKNLFNVFGSGKTTIYLNSPNGTLTLLNSNLENVNVYPTSLKNLMLNSVLNPSYSRVENIENIYRLDYEKIK